jgi:uncharacterized protein YaiE (UPF0345 family)
MGQIDNKIRGKMPSSGPYLAEITNHLDPTHMGGIEVALTDGVPNSVQTQQNSFPVKHLNPFYGVTSSRFQGNNSSDFNDVQKSYGMWFVPPDVGTQVLVIFVNSDPNQGYWIGCVPDLYQNHMVPGIAASEHTKLTAEQKTKYQTTYLPVAEYNKVTNKGNSANVDKIGKPVHPFADRLLQQGLLLDRVRGVTSSSARREVPSYVFGISTPGPLDANGKKGKIGFAGNDLAPVSRKGGSTFVMDDGDVNGQNELVRIRTRTGHQILLHNSSDLIYIGNSKGSAWIELTSNGKIDIYAEDSISMHTKGDFNLRADRDFNLEAGNNFNIAANNNFNLNVQKNLSVISNKMLLESLGDTNLKVGENLKISAGNVGLISAGYINTIAGGTSSHSSTGKFSIGSSAVTAIKGGTDLSLSGGSSVTVSGTAINLNGPAATAPTTPATPSLDIPVPLNLYSLPNRSATTGWGGGNFYKSGDISSIMQRVPTHEPWPQHESVAPASFTLDKTSSDIEYPVPAANGAVIPPTPSANSPKPYKAGPGIDKGTVQGQPFSWSNDQPFLTKVKQVCSILTFDPIDLLAVMHLESAATFDPAIPNGVGYFGLIQFGKAAATTLGTTTSYLTSLSRVDQMDWVLKYFQYWKWPNKTVPSPTLANIYMTVFLPKYRFADPETKVADGTSSDANSRAYYFGNPAFDPAPKKGYITPNMVALAASQHRVEVLRCLEKAGVTSDLIVPTK